MHWAISSSLVFCILLAWSLRTYLLEIQYQSLMRPATDCGDKDSIFLSIQASDLLQQGGGDINIHFKSACCQPLKSIGSELICYHGFGANSFSFEPFFDELRKPDCPIAVSASAHDCPGFGLTERKKSYGFYSLDTNGVIGSVISKQHSLLSTARTLDPSPFLLSSDLDGTMVGDDDEGTREFRDIWDLTYRGRGCKIIYNTGRSFESVKNLLREKECLAVPDVIICGVGAEVYLSTEGKWKEDESWSSSLDVGWDIDHVCSAADRFISQAALQPSASTLPFTAYFRPQEDQLKHKCSLTVHISLLDDALASLHADLDRENIAHIIIVSFHGDLRVLDIIPKSGGKMNAMDYIRKLFCFSREATVAAGDSANDILMLEGSHCSIAVANSQPDLLQWLETKYADQSATKSSILLTKSREARGVIEGLKHFGFSPPSQSPRIYLGHSVGSISAATEAIRLQREGKPIGALILIAPAIFSQPRALGRLAKGALSVISFVSLCLLRLLRPLLVLLLRSLVRSKAFWIRGLQSAYYDPLKLTARMVESYRLASMVKGWEVGLCRFIESRVMPSEALDVAEIAALECPILIVHGRQDKLVPLGNSLKLAERLKCKIHIVEECGHSPQEEQASALINAIAPFIGHSK